MKRSLFVFTLVLLIASTATAQAPDTVWSKIFDTEVDDYCLGATFTSDGFLVLTGIHYIDPVSPGFSSDAALRKVDADGNEVWYHHYDYDGQDQVYTVAETPDSDLIVFGLTGPGTGNSFAPLILKTDADGLELWHQSYPVADYDVIGWSGIQTADKGFLMVGSYKPTGLSDGMMDGMIMKTDSAGVLQWRHEYGGDFEDCLYNAVQIDDGNYVVCGYSYISSGHTQGWILKVDSNGNEIWSTLFGGEEDVTSQRLIETPNGNFLTCGRIGSISPNIGDGYLARFSSDGDSLAFYRYDPLDDDITLLRDMIPVYGGDPASSEIVGYCISGWTQADATDFSTTDNILICVDLSGSLNWYLELGIDGEEWSAWGFTEAWNGGSVLAGQANYNTTDEQAVIVYRLEPMHLSGIGGQIVSLPTEFTLSRAWPNPFNPSTSVTLTLPKASYLTLAVYDVLGREVATLAEYNYGAGTHHFTFDGSDLTSGLYFIKAFTNAGAEQTRKVVLMK